MCLALDLSAAGAQATHTVLKGIFCTTTSAQKLQHVATRHLEGKNWLRVAGGQWVQLHPSMNWRWKM